MEWQPIETAPKDGRPFQAEIPGYGSDFVIRWQELFVDEFFGSYGCWTIAEEQEPPEDWTDGVCWKVNEDLKPSTLPSRWKPLPDPPEATK